MPALFNTIEVHFGDGRKKFERTVDEAAGEFMSVSFHAAGDAGAPDARVLVGRSPVEEDGVVVRPGALEFAAGVACASVQLVDVGEVVLVGFTATEVDPYSSLPERSYPAGVRVRICLSRA